MVHNKRKKTSRQRGSWTHGWGEKKKHRGAGSRGGRGNAGSGKRGDVKKPTFQKQGRVFGKHGFVKKGRTSHTVGINVGQLDIMKLEGRVGVDIQKDVIRVHLVELGYGKLLGAGHVTSKYEIIVPVATPLAIKRIEQAGGTVKTGESSESEQ